MSERHRVMLEVSVLKVGEHRRFAGDLFRAAFPQMPLVEERPPEDQFLERMVSANYGAWRCDYRLSDDSYVVSRHAVGEAIVRRDFDRRDVPLGAADLDPWGAEANERLNATYALMGKSANLSETQLAILFVMNGTFLRKQWDGRWMPQGAGNVSNPPLFANEDVRLLTAMGYAEMLPLGAIITEAGRAELVRRHLIPAKVARAT